MPAAAPSARRPSYSSGAPKPDNKRKYAIFAGAGAAVVVVAVIVFLVLNSGSSSGNSAPGARAGDQPTAGQSSPKPPSEQPGNVARGPRQDPDRMPDRVYSRPAT